MSIDKAEMKKTSVRKYSLIYKIDGNIIAKT